MYMSARMQNLYAAKINQILKLAFAAVWLMACGEILAARQIPNLGRLININTASAAEIAIALPGIGPQKAQRIVERRQTYGDFQSREQLLEVKGIGPKTLEKIEGLYHLGDSSINLGRANTEKISDRWILQDIIKQANRDRLFALGSAKSGGSALPR